MSLPDSLVKVCPKSIVCSSCFVHIVKNVYQSRLFCEGIQSPCQPCSLAKTMQNPFFPFCPSNLVVWLVQTQKLCIAANVDGSKLFTFQATVQDTMYTTQCKFANIKQNNASTLVLPWTFNFISRMVTALGYLGEFPRFSLNFLVRFISIFWMFRQMSS